jgi:pimeloyl-ACP methyl ester carboxylesterase
VPSSEVLQVDEAGHSPYFEQPAVFNRAVMNFLTRHTA